MSAIFPGSTYAEVVKFKSYKDTCVEECPVDTKESVDADGTPICEKCENCPKKCFGGLISSVAALQGYEGCTHINDKVIIQLSGGNQIIEVKGFKIIIEIHF